MNKIFLFIVLAFSISVKSQELPTEPKNGFAFPLGSMFTIKLYPNENDSNLFDYSIVRFESYEETVDTWENENLFEENGEEGTLDFCFCIGTSGKTEAEKNKNMKILLLIKNRTKYALKYESEIQLKENGEFEPTSNVGVYPEAKATEMWPYMIHQIGLFGFKKMN